MLTDREGNPRLFNVNRNEDGSWLDNNDGNPDDQWNPDISFAFVARNPLHFSPGIVPSEFCFASWPLQPPSIRPTSSNGFESAAYFLVSNDLDSQSIINKILAVSSLRMASRMKGSFSCRGVKLAAAIASTHSIRIPSMRWASVKRCAFGAVGKYENQSR